MSEALEFRTTHDSPTLVVARVQGVLDASTVPMLLSWVAAHRAAGRHLVLNLAGVSFIASSGVGALLSLDEELRNDGASFRLAQLSPGVDSVLRLLNLDQFLTIEPSEEAAIAAAGH